MITQAPKIKICGLRDVATIQAMSGLPIDEVGFIFASSKRQVGQDEAHTLIQAVHDLPPTRGQNIRAVGVFVNHELDELDTMLQVLPLDVVQLHGSEQPAYCSALRSRHPQVAIWKVFSVSTDAKHDAESNTEEQIYARVDPYKSVVDAILIDAPGGGTGQPFQWDQISMYKNSASALGLPLYVAGGLSADNVQVLLKQYQPDGIDVSSGVETNGWKDIDKIKLFVGKVMEQ